ncbi:MAG: cell division protein FtsQ/DivIB, partial [Acidimicrobiales bacterium]
MALFVGFAVVTSLCTGGFALVHSSLLGARHVEVTGASHTPRAEVLSAAGLVHPTPLADLSAPAIASRVETLPWVKTADVNISWPETVSIKVNERVPVAVMALPASGRDNSSRSPRFAVCDPTARILALTSGRIAGLPMMAPLGETGQPTPGRFLGGDAPSLASIAAAMPE